MPEAGLEPARISPHAPQTCVSANSTTPARGAHATSLNARPGPPACQREPSARLTRRAALTTLGDSPPGSHPRRSSWPSSATWSPSRSRRRRRPTARSPPTSCPSAQFDGQEVLKVAPEALTLVAREAFRDVVVPLPARPPRAARAPSSTTPRPRRTTAAWRSPSSGTPRSRPASCSRCARTPAPPRSSARRASASGPAGATRSTSRAASSRPTPRRTSATRRPFPSRCTTRPTRGRTCPPRSTSTPRTGWSTTS